MTTETHPLVGTVVHALGPFTLASGFNSTSASRVVQRGDTITITQAHIDASRDRNGDSWIERHLSDGYESKRLGRGPWPEGKPTWILGSPDWAMAREAARLEAHAHPTEEQRTAALREVHRVFGPSAPTSRTLWEEK